MDKYVNFIIKHYRIWFGAGVLVIALIVALAVVVPATSKFSSVHVQTSGTLTTTPSSDTSASGYNMAGSEPTIFPNSTTTVPVKKPATKTSTTVAKKPGSSHPAAKKPTTATTVAKAPSTTVATTTTVPAPTTTTTTVPTEASVRPLITADFDAAVPAQYRVMVPDWTWTWATTTPCSGQVTGCTEGAQTWFTPALLQADEIMQEQLVAHEFGNAVAETLLFAGGDWTQASAPQAARSFAAQDGFMHAASNTDAFASCLTRAWMGTEQADEAAPTPCSASLAQTALADAVSAAEAHGIKVG